MLKITLLMLGLVLICTTASAEVPNYFNYQGRLTDDAGNLVDDGTYQVALAIYDVPTGGSPLWQSTAIYVAVTDGLFSVVVSSIDYGDLSVGGARYLGITVGSDPEISPRTILTTMPYAHHAAVADSAITAAASPDADWDIDGADIYHETGNVGIGNTNPGEDLVVGNNIGSYSGNRVVIADDEAGVSTGLVIGKDSNSRSWILWDVDESYLSVGTKEEGTNYGNTFYIKGGNVGIGVSPIDSVALFVDNHDRNIGVYSIISNVGSEVNRIGIRGEAYGAYNTTGLYGIADGLGFAASAFGVYGSGIGGVSSYGGFFSGGHVKSPGNYAGYFAGKVEATDFIGSGSAGMKIDHPLDPENQYLIHSNVVSPDMMNIYNGNVITDANGNATVELPEYIETLNIDFRYQLTVIGSFAQAIISEKIKGNIFAIKTNKPNIEVSWQVTGVRNDNYAKSNRIESEVDKPDHETGKYLHYEEYTQPFENSVNYKHLKDAYENSRINEEEYID